MKAKRALILGVSGQDGGLLSDLLLKKGYEVHGASRDVDGNSFAILHALGIKNKITFHSVSEGDFRSVLAVLKNVQPAEIYNLSGQSSVGLSFEQPLETMESIALATLRILEAIRFLGLETRYYQASSSEMFGNTAEPANEETPFRPRSPYGVAKAAAHTTVVNYREAYNLFACCGILFNHESQYRPQRFVTQRIAESAARIALGKENNLTLGDITIKRDWGWAEEYVNAMWLMLQTETPEDFVIATGKTHSLREFINECFHEVGLEADKFIKSESQHQRPTDIMQSYGDPMKAKKILNWQASIAMSEVAHRMTRAAYERIKNS